MRKQILEKFIENISDEKNTAPLFELDEVGVKINQIKSKSGSYDVLTRSKRLDELFEKVVSSALSDPSSEGIIYFLYQKVHKKNIVPLYLGIARKNGKQKAKSSLFLNRKSKPRWEYRKNGNFHLSDLSTIVCNAGYSEIERKKVIRKEEWAYSIFKNNKFPIAKGETPILRESTFLSLIEWKGESKSFTTELEHTSISCEEAILIDLLNEFYPEKLLNKIV